MNRAVARIPADATVGRRAEVRVPATSANLGPGFDTLGLALSLYDHLEVTATAEPGVVVEVRGVGAGVVPTDEHNLVAQAVAAAFDRAGADLPGLRLVADNVIPHGGGLGSSAAAIVSGITAARGLLADVADVDLDTLLALATEMEGHPDNVAPALLGGLTIAWSDERGAKAKKLMVHRGVAPLVLVPDYAVSTELARSLQPQSVPVADAVFNLSRSALLVAALVQSPELLLEATEDRLHQDYRASAMPQTASLVRALRDAGHAAVVSGAGPSILVLAADPAERAAASAIASTQTDARWRALPLAVDFKGATVSSHRVDASTQS